jgi:hypothetical protein
LSRGFSALAGRTIAYTGDTAWTGAIVGAAADANLLIAGAYYRDKNIPYQPATRRPRRPPRPAQPPTLPGRYQRFAGERHGACLQAAATLTQELPGNG